MDGSGTHVHHHTKPGVIINVDEDKNRHISTVVNGTHAHLDQNNTEVNSQRKPDIQTEIHGNDAHLNQNNTEVNVGDSNKETKV